MNVFDNIIIMINKNNLPKKIPVFPLSNFIFFPNTSAPLNIFEPRYVQMIEESIKTDRMIGMVQPKNSKSSIKPDLYDVGCLGKITNFNETDDGRYVIVLNGIIRFNIEEELENKKLFREFKVNFNNFSSDLDEKKENIKFSDLDLIFNNLKKIFEKQGYIINWDELKKQSLDQTINTLSMASPFTKEEKQMLLEAKDLEFRKQKLEQIVKIYTSDNFSNKTIQ